MVDRAVNEAYELRYALVTARRFCVYGEIDRGTDGETTVSARVMGAVHVPGQAFVALLDDIAETLLGPPAVGFGGGWNVARQDDIRLLVREAVTQEGYARFHDVYLRCLSVQTTWDEVQTERTGNTIYAWTAAQLTDLGLYFDKLRRLWGLILARVKAVKRLLDALMVPQVEHRRLTSKWATTATTKQDGQGVQELLDALRAEV
jgi:hypothetical protein